MTEKGVSRYWTPERDKVYECLLDTCNTFAEREFIMTIRDLLKYDARTKEGKRARAQGRLRLATASDEDLKELAELEAMLSGRKLYSELPKRLEELNKLRAKIREKGIKRGELECQ